MTEESTKERFKAGWSALNYTATKLPKDFDHAVRNLMYTCDGKDCVNEEIVFDRKQDIEVVRVQRSEQESVSITMHVCPEYRTQFKKIRGNKCDSMSEVKKLSNSTFRSNDT